MSNTSRSDTNDDDDSFIMMEVDNTKQYTKNLSPELILTLSVTPKHDTIGLNSSMTSTQVCATIRAGGLTQDGEDDVARAPVDIVVALDLSSSMEGDKLKLCKKTLELLIRCLSPKDRFGLVTFADYAKVSVPLATLCTSENKDTIQSKIQALKVGGCTNISAAIGMAAQEMNRIEDPHKVRSVFLLSDGCATRGVICGPAIVQLTKACLTDPSDKNKAKASTTLHCFGYGSDHDEEIMQALSETAQGGTYYFVDGDSNVATAFGDALGGVLSVVAQNVMVRIRPNVEAGTKIMDVYHDSKEKKSDGSYIISLGDFYADEKRDVLFSTSLATLESFEPIAHATISSSYLDTIQPCIVPETSNTAKQCMIARPPGSEVSNANRTVILQWLRVKTARDLVVADGMARKGNIHGSREFLILCLVTLREQPADVQKSPLIQQLMADLNCVVSNLQCESSYRDYGSKMMRNLWQGHTMQRCNAMSQGSQEKNTYRTSKKKDFSTLMGLGSSNDK